MPDHLIAYPFPTQIAAGQALDANAVSQDFVHVASQYNAHSHAYSEITGAPAQAASGGDVWLPGEIKMFPGVYVPSVVGCIMPCLGATMWVASVSPACASAVGTFHGGNASILKLPDMGGRAPVGLATAGNAAVATAGGNEGIAIGNRRGLKHQHTPHLHTTSAPFATVNLGSSGGDNPYAHALGSTTTADGGSGVATDPVDGGAFLVLPFFIRIL